MKLTCENCKYFTKHYRLSEVTLRFEYIDCGNCLRGRKPIELRFRKSDCLPCKHWEQAEDKREQYKERLKTRTDNIAEKIRDIIILLKSDLFN